MEANSPNISAQASPEKIGSLKIGMDDSNASLVTGLFSPDGVAVSGSNLFVTYMTYPGEIGMYTLSNGQATLSNLSLITGLDGPQGILVTAAPTPGSGPLALLGSMALVGGMALRRRIARKQ